MSNTTRYGVPIDDRRGGYGVVFPDLPGCTAMGRTVDEASASTPWRRPASGRKLYLSASAIAGGRRLKCCKLANNPRLRRAVAGKLRLDWSPEQIAGWLKRTHPEDECNQVSHETIYRSLFVQTRGVLKKELLSHLRSKRSMRRSQPVDPNGDRRGHIKDIVSIRQRPAAVEDRAVPGHWEGDLLSGPNNSYIATLVERHTRYVMLAKMAGKDTRTVVTALIKQAKKLPKELYKSLTWDRGKELTDHRRLTLATKIDVYFCDPQSPWQRGSNENTNGLLRQYFPKGTDLSVHSQAYLNKETDHHLMSAGAARSAHQMRTVCFIGANAMRFFLTLGLLITLCASADAATVHHSRHHVIVRPSQGWAYAEPQPPIDYDD